VVIYFAVYVGYLFLRPEGEFLHWLTLVLLPLWGLRLLSGLSFRALPRSLGLRRDTTLGDLRGAAVLGLGFQFLQLLNARQRVEFLGALVQPLGPLLLILAFVLVLGTAATTEECFFRGLVQSRLADFCHSEAAGLFLGMLAFVLYHVPYAYLNPAWPSAGNFPQAVQQAISNGGMSGLALGFVYWRSDRNLLASICLHALINWVPATCLVARLLA